MEHPLGRALDPPSQIQLRAVLRVRRTWLAGRLAKLAVGQYLSSRRSVVLIPSRMSVVLTPSRVSVAPVGSMPDRHDIARGLEAER